MTRKVAYCAPASARTQREHARVPPHERKHQEEDGEEPDQADQRPEPVRAQHQRERARREDEHRGGAERQACAGLA